jgi:cytochrome c55X
VAVFALWPAGGFADVPPARQTELTRLLTQDCGSCHGLTLKGGLGPALTPQALTGKSPEWLREVILEGRPGTPMPPWKPFLSREEAGWIVQQLLRGGIHDR